MDNKKCSRWGIPYIYVRECAFMNLNEKTCFCLLNAPFFFPHEKWKNQEFVKELGFHRQNVGILEKRAHLSFNFKFIVETLSEFTI